jgi:hypothetical protein
VASMLSADRRGGKKSWQLFGPFCLLSSSVSWNLLSSATAALTTSSSSEVAIRAICLSKEFIKVLANKKFKKVFGDDLVPRSSAAAAAAASTTMSCGQTLWFVLASSSSNYSALPKSSSSDDGATRLAEESRRLATVSPAHKFAAHLLAEAATRTKCWGPGTSAKLIIPRASFFSDERLTRARERLRGRLEHEMATPSPPRRSSNNCRVVVPRERARRGVARRRATGSRGTVSSSSSSVAIRRTGRERKAMPSTYWHPPYSFHWFDMVVFRARSRKSHCQTAERVTFDRHGDETTD